MNEITDELQEIVGMVKEYIHFMKICSVDHFPVENPTSMNRDDAHAIDMEETLTRETHHIGDVTAGLPHVPDGKKDDHIDSLREELSECKCCKLSKNRTKLVLGEGDLNAKLVFVGEAPGRDEDLSGRPFVGRAGKLLTKIIKAMGMERHDVYIMNIVKCRPPENRNPQTDEIESCEPFMLKQLGIIKPKVICALGTFSAHTLLKTKEPISRLRGKFFDFHGIKLMPTYHPAYLLRNQSSKREVWEDMQKIMRELN